MVLADEQHSGTGLPTVDGDILWALADNLGSIRDLVDSNGTVKNHIIYDAYGNITSESDSTVDHIVSSQTLALLGNDGRL